MSRIRSIHPGFFTDEEFVSISMEARLLFLGLGVEADDKGVFEWKPVTIKMRLFPADNIDIASALSELEGINAIHPYEIEGRNYGAIRNFRKFQRPKSPNDVHPAPKHIRIYVGLEKPDPEMAGADEAPIPPNGEIPAADEAQFLHLGEIAPQMEEGGGRRLDGGDVGSPSDSSISDAADARPALLPALIDQPDDAQIAFERHDAVRRQFVPNARSVDLTPTRRKHLTARLKEVGGLSGWDEVLAIIRGSPFLRGETSRNGFVAVIDWITKPANLLKVREGNYDDDGNQRAQSHAAKPVLPRSPIGAIAATWDRGRAGR